MLKIAKAYIKGDVATFGDMARNVAAYYPGRFKAMREGGLREIWNYAAGRLDLEEVSKADAEAIYREIDAGTGAEAAQGPQAREEAAGQKRHPQAQDARRVHFRRR